MIARDVFLGVFNQLSVALRDQADPSGVTLETYYAALSDVSLDALTAGAQSLMREPGRRFFPTVPEWRDAATAARIELIAKALPPAREEPWHDECGACGDTGWEYHHCAGGSGESIALCGRKTKHAEHDYVEVCTCRPTNRTYQRRQFAAKGLA